MIQTEHNTSKSDKELNYWADIYLKLKPFIRVFQGKVYWRPAQDIRTPTFEEFMRRKDEWWETEPATFVHIKCVDKVNKAFSDAKKVFKAIGKTGLTVEQFADNARRASKGGYLPVQGPSTEINHET